MMPNESATVRDAQWLISHGFNKLDPIRFSDWVTRLCADGINEHEARQVVLKQMTKK